jgi:hypothetical protein
MLLNGLVAASDPAVGRRRTKSDNPFVTKSGAILPDSSEFRDLVTLAVRAGGAAAITALKGLPATGS